MMVRDAGAVVWVSRRVAWFAALGMLALGMSVHCLVAQEVSGVGVEAERTPEFWNLDVNIAFQLARETDRPMLVHFHTPGCGPCRRMEVEVLSDPEIQRLATDYYIPVKVDGAQFPALASRFYVRSYPSDYILTSDGKMVSRVVGLQTLEGYRTFLAETARRMRFQPLAAPEPADDVVDATLPELELPPFPDGRLTGERAGDQEGAAPDLMQVIAEIESMTKVREAGGPEPELVADTTPTEVIEELRSSAYHDALPEVAEARKMTALLDGFCPVALVERNAWVKGDPAFGVRHRGALYLFENQDAMDRFYRNPDHYALASEGLDVVLWSQRGERTAGLRSFGLRYDGMNFVFANESTREAFRSDPERFASEIRQTILETARLRGDSEQR